MGLEEPVRPLQQPLRLAYLHIRHVAAQALELPPGYEALAAAIPKNYGPSGTAAGESNLLLKSETLFPVYAPRDERALPAACAFASPAELAFQGAAPCPRE